MKKYIIHLIIILVVLSSCKNNKQSNSNEIVKESETDLSAIETKDFRDFKVLDSKYLKNNVIWSDLNKSLEDFEQEDYEALKPLILEQEIARLQKHIISGKLTYLKLTKFYLFRIRKYDRENKLSLNSVIAINPNVIEEAKSKDQEFLNKKLKHPVFGMPILLKDNINASGMPTTAGAIALANNVTDDAFVVKKLKESGAIILGKANLSEWAYFFCGECPSGYSAVGGQTLNPYGRRVIDTGGSSSGSGVSVAANFCVAAVGSETAGSILSPASQNSVVGLKPTIGLLSRSGIIPISSTLDTSGPITKNVTDNAIMLDAMFGNDIRDNKSIVTKWSNNYYKINFNNSNLKGKRFGAYKRLLEDSLYVNAIKVLKEKGAIIVEIEEPKVELPDFVRLLNLDMQEDLPKYLSDFANSNITFKSVEDIINYNNQDSLLRSPYGQALFKGVAEDKSSVEEFSKIKTKLKKNGEQFFNIPMKANNLDGFLSINNYHAASAAVAEYPAMTVPMGYTSVGEPKGITFIASPLKELDILNWAYIYEQASKARIAPSNYN
ncbi:amidase family protein [Lacinutrix sp.]|uniref:amidase family protein n=1 Tax=Lacinutrix sp. TaxID=1937692 RepID=UPI0025BA7B07|nr:amidase family protein [Lacinutrix sp.]